MSGHPTKSISGAPRHSRDWATATWATCSQPSLRPFVPATHPYTIHGRQLDVLINGPWLELAECGLIAPALLERCGLSPDGWSGLALGMGLDRALMLRKGIDDIRTLRSADPGIQAQMF